MTNLLYELLYVLPVSAGLLSLLSSELIGKEIGITVVIIQVIIAGIFVLFKKLRWTGRMIMISVFIMLIIAGFFLSGNENIAELMQENSSYIWLLGIGAFAFCVGELMCLFRIIRVIVSGVAAVWMIVCTALGYDIEKLFVAVAFLLVLLTIVEEIQIRWEKQGQTEHKGHLVFVSPFIILVIALVLISPAPDEPYDWGFAKKIYEVVTDAIESVADLFSKDETTNPAESRIGFSERGDITGSISGGDKKAMTVLGLSSYVDQIRLAGKTFTDFDGKIWTDNDTSDMPASLIDTIAMTASLNDFTDRDNDYARRSYINIEFDGVTTDHVFLPLKSLPKKWGLQTSEYKEQGGDVLWPDIHASGSMYAISYYLLNRDNEVIKDYLKNGKAPTEESYSVMEKRLNTDRIDACSYADYQAYVEYIKKTYTVAPELSQRLREYMDKVYEGAESDIEKMERLESMLREYEYTLNPGAIPDSVNNSSDFLDYLILDSKKGFCAHYATAFVLLARAEGIPARYVQGYMADTKGKTSIIVKNANAHAWPEVYLDGAGWISFEPTPSMNEGHSYWKTASEKEALKPFEDDYSYDTAATEEGDGVFFNIHITWYMIVIPIAIGIFFVILSLIIGRLISAAGFRRMTEEERFISICRQNLRILKYLSPEKKKNETLHEYGLRLTEAGIENTGFLKDYETLLYKEMFTGGATEGAEADRSALIIRLKKENRWRYIRYLIGFR